MNNYINLDLERVREIIKDRLKIEPINAGICTEYKGSISIFNDRLTALKNNNFYALVPKGYSKDSSGKWVYDISDFKIYGITKEYVILNGIDINNLEYGKATVIKLHDDLVIYSSSEGLKDNLHESSSKFLTGVEFACLYLRIPTSGTDWLDNLIKQANIRDEKEKFNN